MANKTEKLKAIKDELLTQADLPLFSYRTENDYFPVIGEGSHDAKIIFIGEAPGKNEAKTGRPFCGAAGRILDELLASINLARTEVYITNIVKDRPPENRDPLPVEIEAYGPYLDRQIEIIKPAVIATLGRFSMVYVMNRFGLGDVVSGIGSMHGRLFEAETSYGPIKILPLYHPAAAIYNQSLKGTLREDFAKLKEFI